MFIQKVLVELNGEVQAFAKKRKIVNLFGDYQCCCAGGSVKYFEINLIIIRCQNENYRIKNKT